MGENYFAYPWFEMYHLTHLCYVSFVFRNPPLLKSGVNMYFAQSLCLSPPKTKNNTKMQEKQDQKVVLVSPLIHINLEHEEHTQKNKT